MKWNQREVTPGALSYVCYSSQTQTTTTDSTGAIHRVWNAPCCKMYDLGERWKVRGMQPTCQHSIRPPLQLQHFRNTQCGYSNPSLHWISFAVNSNGENIYFSLFEYSLWSNNEHTVSCVYSVYFVSQNACFQMAAVIFTRVNLLVTKGGFLWRQAAGSVMVGIGILWEFIL